MFCAGDGCECRPVLNCRKSQPSAEGQASWLNVNGVGVANVVDSLRPKTTPGPSTAKPLIKSVAVAQFNSSASAGPADRTDFRRNFTDSVANYRRSGPAGASGLLRLFIIALALNEDAKALGTDLAFLQVDPLTYRDLQHGTF